MSRVLVEGGPDAGAAWHFGDPALEQKKLLLGQGWADLSHKSIIKVTGPDRLSWLNAITTQEVESLNPYEWKSALILDALGHIKFQFLLVDDGISTWLVLDSILKSELIAYLEKMKFLLRVEITDESANYAALRIPGVPDSLGGPFKIYPRAELEESKGSIFSDVIEVGTWALEAERIAAGRARILFETDYKSIPNELALLGHEVHMKKGCYPGQETVAKINNLGQPPRRLTLLHLDGTEIDLPKSGEKIFDGEKEVGYLGSVIRHFELGPIGLGVIRKSVPIESTLVIAGVSASQELVKR